MTKKIQKIKLIFLLLSSMVLVFFIIIFINVRRNARIIPTTIVNNDKKDNNINQNLDTANNYSDYEYNTKKEDTMTDNNLKVSIQNINKTKDNITIKVITSSFGSCVFTFTPEIDGKPIIREVSVIDNICIVSMSVLDFNYIGNWKLNVTYYKNNLYATLNETIQID